MATYTVINGTNDNLVDINGAGDDVPALSQLSGTTLTNTELGTLLGTAGVAAIKSGPTADQRRLLSRIMRFGIYPTDRN